MQRVLIINNGSTLTKELQEAFPGSCVKGFDELNSVNTQEFDLIVLSGSNQFPVHGNEEKLSRELELIRSSTVPVLGICFGFELVVVAFGGTLVMLPEKIQGVREVELIQPDELFRGVQKLVVYEGHRWVAEKVPYPLIPLARSEYGIEAVRHESKLIYGLQFHPEKHVEETAGRMILDNMKTLIASEHTSLVNSELAQAENLSSKKH